MRSLAGAFIVGLLGLLVNSVHAAEKQPNIVVIETDVDVEDEMRSLIAPVKPGLLVTE